MEKREFRIASKDIQGANVMRITLEAPETLEDLVPSVFLRIFNDQGEMKPYTPLKIEGRLLYHAIKIYENGPVSSFLAGLNVGDKIAVGGFESKRKFTINEHKNILMICGGTGITPIFQILNYAMNNPECTSKFKVLFYNTTKENVFLSEDLEELQGLRTGEHLDVEYIMTQGPGAGKDMAALRNNVINPIKKACAGPSYDFVYVCGTDGFLGAVCGAKTKDKKQGELSGVLRELGYMPTSVYKF